MNTLTRFYSVSMFGMLLLAGTPNTVASNFCPHGGKNYSVHATRCEDGVRLRCNKGNEWKPIGKCKAPVKQTGSNFCPHGGKNYSVHATRCESGDRLRCNKGNEWKRVGSC